MAFELAGIDSSTILASIDAFKALTGDMYLRIKEINDAYRKLKETNDSYESLQEINEAAQSVNKQILTTFKILKDEFYRLDLEENKIFGHEQAQKEIVHLSDSIKKLKAGEIAPVIENLLPRIGNMGLNCNFSPVVVFAVYDNHFQHSRSYSQDHCGKKYSRSYAG